MRFYSNVKKEPWNAYKGHWIAKVLTTLFYSKQIFTVESLRRDVTVSSDSTVSLPFIKYMDLTGLGLGIFETCK